jgi:polysaccharide pyruvyl transferase WcaK-like protein
MRRLSADIVAETAEGVMEWEMHSYRQSVGNIYALNMQIDRRKYSMNFLINLLYRLGTVGILIVGGWFVMQGRTEIGTVVAFLFMGAEPTLVAAAARALPRLGENRSVGRGLRNGTVQSGSDYLGITASSWTVPS